MFKNYDDETLVMLTLAGETKAYETLVKRYQNAVIGSAFTAINNRFFAEDAAQDAFVTAWMKLDSLQDGAKFLPWVKRIARNCALNLITRYKTALNIDDFISLSDGNNVSPEEICILNEESKDLQDTIEKLPEKTRLVIKYHYFDDLSVTQIAEVLGISEGTVKWQLHDGRKRLRKELCAMNENLNDNLVQKVMKKVEELKLWQLKNNKTGFEKVYKDTLKAVEELPESQVKYHAMADVLARGWWWIKGKKNDELFEKIKETALLGKNEEVIQYIFQQEQNKWYDRLDILHLLCDKQIPCLEENGFTEALADAYIRLGIVYYSGSESEKGDEQFEKASSLLSDKSLNKAYADMIKAQHDIFEKEYAGKGLEAKEYRVSGTACEIKTVDENVRFWQEKNCGGGEMREYGILEYASRCDGFFTIPSFSVGQTYENADGSTLTFVSDNETVTTPCDTFENCQLWITKIKSGNGCIVKNYFKKDLFIVKQELCIENRKIVRFLKDYNVSAPIEKCNTWEYVRANENGAVEGFCKLRVAFADEEKLIITELCNTKRNFYDETLWEDMIDYLTNRYYVKTGGQSVNINGKIPYYVEKAKALAKTPSQIAHTKHLCAMMQRIVNSDRTVNPNTETQNVWSFFDKDFVIKSDDQISLKATYDSIAWKNTNASPAEIPVLCSRVFDILNSSAGCIWSDSWELYGSKTIENWIYDEIYIKTEITSNDGGKITTKAGTFDNCLKITINSSIDDDDRGHDYMFGKMYYYFAKGIGIVKFQKECDVGVVSYDLVEYDGIDENTYMPTCDGIYRRYEAQNLTDGYIAGCGYTIQSDEDGDTYMYTEIIGERKQPIITSYSFIHDELMEETLWDAGKYDEARFRNSVNNFKLLMHFVCRWSPNYGVEERAVQWGKTRLKYIEASFDNGEIPPALYGFYSYTLFLVAHPHFGRHTRMNDEGYALLDKAFKYRRKWDAIPDGTILEVGNDFVFGGIKIKKGDNKIYLPDGSSEYCEYGYALNPNKDLMYSAMSAKGSWGWFNPVRDDDKFLKYTEIAKQIAES